MGGQPIADGPPSGGYGWGSVPACVLDGELGLGLDLLAAAGGPDGFDGAVLAAAFGQSAFADLLPPSPALAALTARAASTPGSLTDDELIGVLQAARRMANLAAYQQTVMIAEFARRRQAEFEAAKARGVPVGCRDGEFPGEELAMELIDTSAYTGARIDTAIELTARLPRTPRALAASNSACRRRANSAIMTVCW